jgi:hypothetical protein
VTRAEGNRSDAPNQFGVRGALASPGGETRTTGSRATGGETEGAAAAGAFALPDESVGGVPGVQSRFTTRGEAWCPLTVIARRADIEGAW